MHGQRAQPTRVTHNLAARHACFIYITTGTGSSSASIFDDAGCALAAWHQAEIYATSKSPRRCIPFVSDDSSRCPPRGRDCHAYNRQARGENGISLDCSDDVTISSITWLPRRPATWSHGCRARAPRGAHGLRQTHLREHDLTIVPPDRDYHIE